MNVVLNCDSNAMKTHTKFSIVIAAASIVALSCHATPVVGPWANAAGQGDGPIIGANSASPTVGDGTANSADGEMIHSAFSAITLANSGDKIVFTGNVQLIGTVNSLITSGTPR